MKIKTPKYPWRNYQFGTISLCMIMRDNAKTLARCLDSVVGLVNEIIIVDTGSKDNSIDIAKSYNAKVLTDPWQDDFARPRNIGIKQATCQWILVLDPDELVLAKDHDEIRQLTNDKKFAAFWVTTHNYAPKNFSLDYVICGKGNDPIGECEGYTPSTKTRFWKNGLGIRFEGVWHELTDWYIRRHKLLQGSAKFAVHHWNHEITQESAKAKGKFYLRMGEKKVKQWPNLAQARWELATAELKAGLRKRASKTLATAFRLGFNRPDMYFNLSRCQRLLGNIELAELAFQKGVCVKYPALTHVDTTKKPFDLMLKDI